MKNSLSSPRSHYGDCPPKAAGQLAYASLASSPRSHYGDCPPKAAGQLAYASLAITLVMTAAACSNGAGSSSSSASGAKPTASTKPTSSATPTSNATTAAPTTAKPAEPAAASTTAAPTPAGGCPETEKGKRACTAPEFQKAWKASKSPTTFPDSAKYTVSGTITKVQVTDKSKGETGGVWIQMKGDSAEVAFKFEPDNKDLAAATKLKVGAEAKFTCSFGGLEEIGVVTLEKCAI